MLVKEFIIKNLIESSEDRLEKLKEIGAPDIMIKSVENQIENLKSGKNKVGGSIHLLDKEYVSHECTKGKGGKLVVIINGNIKYCPSAKYGQYIVEC